MWRVVLIFLVALAGLWLGKPKEPYSQPEKSFPILEHKPFVVILYVHNQVAWCERALRSVFEQEYDRYRLIVIDDGSLDGTAQKGQAFIVDNNQSEKVTWIQNKARLGPAACLYRAIQECADWEIVLPLEEKGWLASPLTLSQLNAAYQNPDVWIAFGQTIGYPSYEVREGGQISCYADLFKQAGLEASPARLIERAEGRVRKLQEGVAFTPTCF